MQNLIVIGRLRNSNLRCSRDRMCDHRSYCEVLNLLGGLRPVQVVGLVLLHRSSRRAVIMNDHNEVRTGSLRGLCLGQHCDRTSKSRAAEDRSRGLRETCQHASRPLRRGQAFPLAHSFLLLRAVLIIKTAVLFPSQIISTFHCWSEPALCSRARVSLAITN